MKGLSASWLPNTAGFVLVQAILIVLVLSHPFESLDTSAARKEAWDASQAGLYFIQAETAAKRLLANPSSRWDHYTLDQETFCAEAGQGIWQARGTVRIPEGSSSKVEPWEVYFRPGQLDSPLFVQVGNLVSGNPEVVKRLTDPVHGR